MNLDAIKQQTTWNDAATSINSNFAKLLQAILALEGGGGNEGGGLDESQLEAYLIANGYTTQAWVLAQKFLKEITSEQVIEALQYTPLNPSDADTKYAPLSGFNTLKSDFDALNAALNDDVSGKINTWNEIVDFVDEYSGSTDLATIISGINAEVNKRLLISTFDTFLANEYNPLKAKVTDLEQFEQTTNGILGDLTSRMVAAETAITTNTTAIQAVDLKVTTLGNHMTEVDETIVAIQTQVSTNKTNIEKLLGWFQLDSSGNLYTTYNFYSTKEISANGLSQGTEESGLIKSVLGVSALGTSLTEDNTAVFNAFATNKVYNDLVALASRVDNLATTTSAVGWKGEIASGKKIGTLTINGLENYLYTPATYAFSEITGKPTTLSGYGITDNVVKYYQNDFTPAESELSAQSVFERLGKGFAMGRSNWSYADNGYLTTPFGAIDLAGVSVLQWKSRYGPDSTYTQLYITATTSSGTANATTGEMLYYVNNGDNYSPTWYRVLTNKNYSKYALPLTGGRIDASVRTLYLNLNSTNPNVIEFMSNGTRTGFLGIRSDGNPLYMDSSLTQYDLLHLGNYSQYALQASNGDYYGVVFTSTLANGATRLILKNNNDILVGINSDGTNATLVNHKTSEWLGLRDGVLKYYDKVNERIVLHSGNIEDYAMLAAIGSHSNPTSGITKTGVTYWSNGVAAGYRGEYGTSLWVHFNPKGTSGSRWRNRLDFATTGQISLWQGINTETMSYIGELAYTHSNVASATKLQTARTIWGQSFDGTGNVTGALSGVTNINGALNINSSGNVTIGSSDLAGTDVKLRADGNIAMGNGLTSELRMTRGYWNRFIATETGGMFAWRVNGSDTDAMVLHANEGRLGIGTTAPSYKLDVAGSARVGDNVDGGLLLQFSMDRPWGFYQQGTGADSALVLKSSTNSKNFVIQDETGGYIARFFAASTNSSVQIYTPLNVNGLTKVNADMYAAGSFYFATNSDYGGYLAANPEGWFGIYSAKKGAWQATNIYCYPNGEVGLPHGAKIIGKSPNGDTALRVEGSQYTLFFGIGSGNVNRGIYDVTKESWWIYRDASPLTRIIGGISTSTGAFSDAVTMSSTLSAGATTLSSLTVSANINCNYMLAKNSVQAGLTSTYSTYIDGASDGGRMGVLKNGVHSATLLKIQEDGKGLFYNTILANSANAIQFVYGNYGVIHRNDGSSYYILLTNSGYSSGTFNDLRPFRINLTNGNVGMGHNLSVSGTVTVSSQLSVGYTGSHGYQCYIGGTYTKGLYVGKDAVFKGNIEADGEISGNVLNTGSDIRFKKRIEDVVLDLDTMADAPMFRFTWNNRKDDRVYIGSSAQYWKGTSARELVSRGCDDFHRLDYATLGVLFGVSLAKKAKNHEERIKELEKEVSTLKEENRRLRYGN